MAIVYQEMLGIISFILCFSISYSFYNNIFMEKNMLGYNVRQLQIRESDDRWVDQKVDHFNPTDERIWRQVMLLFLYIILNYETV